MPEPTFTSQPAAAPNAAPAGMLPQLYSYALGSLNAAYYQKEFERLDALGRPAPSWNTAAAFCTFGWLVLRRFWRGLALYAPAWLFAVACAVAMRGRVPLGLEMGVDFILATALIVAPGLGANILYHRHINAATIRALQQSATLAQAQQQLERDHAATPQRQRQVAIAHAAVVAVLLILGGVGLWLSSVKSEDGQTTAAPAPAVGPPVLHFPTLPSAVQQGEPQAQPNLGQNGDMASSGMMGENAPTLTVLPSETPSQPVAQDLAAGATPQLTAEPAAVSAQMAGMPEATSAPHTQQPVADQPAPVPVPEVTTEATAAPNLGPNGAFPSSGMTGQNVPPLPSPAAVAPPAAAVVPTAPTVASAVEPTMAANPVVPQVAQPQAQPYAPISAGAAPASSATAPVVANTPPVASTTVPVAQPAVSNPTSGNTPAASAPAVAAPPSTAATTVAHQGTVNNAPIAAPAPVASAPVANNAPSPVPAQAPAQARPPQQQRSTAPPPPRAQAGTAASAATPSSNAGALIAGKYYLSVGVYAEATNARRNERNLRAAGLPVISQTVSGQRGPMTRIRLGPFDSRAQAEQAQRTAARQGLETSVFQHRR